MNYRYAALFSYTGKYGLRRRGVGAASTVLATISSSWRALYPNSGSFEGRGVVVDRGVLRRARGSH
jgi:hypothetical protein